MLNLKGPITAIRQDFLQLVREQGIDDLGQAVEYHIAKGGEPCRDVLRRARSGEALILASYCPFSKVGPYREYGPVFVLAEHSGEEIDLMRINASPIAAEQAYLGAQFVLRAYSDEERIIDACLSSPEKAESDLERLFALPKIAFILCRFPTYGCYALRLDAPTLRAEHLRK